MEKQLEKNKEKETIKRNLPTPTSTTELKLSNAMRSYMEFLLWIWNFVYFSLSKEKAGYRFSSWIY